MDGTQVPQQQVRDYCVRELSRQGIKVLDNLSGREARDKKIPLLVIRLEAVEDPRTPGWCRIETKFEYWDVALVKRNPAFENYQKLIAAPSSVCSLAPDDYAWEVWWPATRDRLKSEIALFISGFRMFLERTPDDMEFQPEAFEGHWQSR